MATASDARRRWRGPVFEPGTVWLAGAGPGDPGLLTLLAHQALAEADIILHDALVDDAILDLADPAAERVMVGKRAGCRSTPQAAINARLIHEAMLGRRVLRLKGGDPFVFGRGGEECLALAAAGIAFRVVPGVTAGIGGLAAAGIPLTHRGVGRAAAFLTGHDVSGDLIDGVDWRALAAMPTLVVYMGLRVAGTVAARLMGAGRAPETPVAVVSEASTARQVLLVTTLAGCAEAIAAARPPAPALLVIGETVAIAAELAPWQQGAADAPAVASAARGGYVERIFEAATG